MSAPQQAVLMAGGAATDPNFASVVLLCHADGTNNQTTSTDSSSAAHALTQSINAGVKLTTSQFKFGTTSYDFSTKTGGAELRVSATDSADWSFGSGQFTIEGFVRQTTVAQCAFVSQLNSSSFGWWLGMNDATTLIFYYSTTGSDLPSVSGAWTPSANTWYHVAVDRDASNVVRIYVDGVVKGSATVASTFFNATGLMCLGNDERLSRQLTGYIDEVRITKGVARYGGAFSPPTAAFPDA